MTTQARLIDPEPLLADVDYAMRQCRVAFRATCDGSVANDCISRALDALERVQETLEGPSVCAADEGQA